MCRYSILLIDQNQYYQLSFDDYSEATTRMQVLFTKEGKEPVGIYDAKTELFQWEPVRQHYYDQLSIEEQGRLGSEIIAIAQTLRSQQAEHQKPGVLQQPIFSQYITSL